MWRSEFSVVILVLLFLWFHTVSCCCAVVKCLWLRDGACSGRDCRLDYLWMDQHRLYTAFTYANGDEPGVLKRCKEPWSSEAMIGNCSYRRFGTG